MIAAGVAAPVIMGVLLRSRLFRFDPASLVERIIEERSFKAPSGKIVRRNRYAIDFSDGYRWSSHRTITTLPEGDEEQFVAYISERSGIPIDIVDPHRKPENQKVYDQGSGNLPPG